MGRVIFVEVLDRRGRVSERVRLERFPATIGRAYTNDVIVSDRFVSPEHCSIRESDSGEILVEDRGSLNGLGVPASRHFVPSLLLRSGDRFRIGQTVLRLVEAGQVIAPAEPLPKDGRLLQAFGDRRLALGVCGVSVAAMALEQFLGAYDDPGWVGVLNPVVLALAGLCLWAGIWAFANRLSTHRFDFLRHLACACLAAILLLFAETLSEYVEFWSSSRNLAVGVEAWGFALVILALFSAHLAIIPVSTRRGRHRWAVSGTMLVLGLLALFYGGGADATIAEVPVTVPIKTLGVEWMPAISTREFLERSREVREGVDAEAAEGAR